MQVRDLNNTWFNTRECYSKLNNSVSYMRMLIFPHHCFRKTFYYKLNNKLLNRLYRVFTSMFSVINNFITFHSNNFKTTVLFQKSTEFKLRAETMNVSSDWSFIIDTIVTVSVDHGMFQETSSRFKLPKWNARAEFWKLCFRIKKGGFTFLTRGQK